MLELTPPPTLRDVAEHAGVSITTVERVLAESPLVGARSRDKVRDAITVLGYSHTETNRRNPTISDVAQLAKVSIATVSRVMSDSGQVQAATRDRVLAAMGELDFVANGHARALNRTGQGQVAVLSGSMLGASFVGIAQGIESVVSPRGHQFVVHTTGGDRTSEAAHVESLREQRAQAVIFIGGVATDDEEYRQQIARYAQSLDSVGSRLILAGRPPVPGLPAVPSVDYDNRFGMRRLTEHLIGLGHTRIAFIGGGPHTTNAARHAGYTAAMDAAGLPEIAVIGPNWEVEDGESAAAELWQRDQPPTAIVAARDLVAVGAIRELRRRGLRVPDDVSVTGFDDLPLTADLTPPLTTVRPEAELIGRTIAGLALAREVEPDTALVLPVEVILRGSAAPPP